MDATLEKALAIVMNRYSISEWWSLSSKQRVALIYSELRRLDRARVVSSA